MKPLRVRFVAGKVEHRKFGYVGFDVSQEIHGKIELNMNKYMQSCGSGPISPGKSDHELSPEEETDFRAVVGQLNWIAQGTRPDKVFDIITLSTKFKNATLDDLKSGKKMLIKMKERECKIVFPSLQMTDIHMEVYTDAAHANLPDGISSAYAYIIFLVDSSRNACPLSWKANKIRRVVKSTLAAETLALMEGIDEAIYLKKILSEMCPKMQIPIDGYVDNKSLVDALKSTHLVEERRLRIDIGILKQNLERDIRQVIWIPGDRQLANCMTKKGASGDSLLTIFHSGKLVSR